MGKQGDVSIKKSEATMLILQSGTLSDNHKNIKLKFKN
jgi:hypothetical protein